ncbi:MAG: DUF1573 domain-containing protein [Lacibacter sp.]|jgi:hypothetical protein
MKHLVLLLVCAFTLAPTAFAQKKKNKQPGQEPQVAATVEPLTASEYVYDFGKIPQGKPVYHTFTIYNNGLESFQLQNVQTSCGCTTPEYSKEPVAKGGSTTIKVGYNAAAEGYFEKSITFYYNDGESKQLIIKGFVWKTPDASVPANAALQVFQKKH